MDINMSESDIKKLYQIDNEILKKFLISKVGKEFFYDGITTEVIEAVSLKDIEVKRNNAFIFLSKACALLNNGWAPTNENRGFVICSNKLRVNSFSNNINEKGFSWNRANWAGSGIAARIGNTLVFKDSFMVEFIIEKYPNILKDLFMINE